MTNVVEFDHVSRVFEGNGARPVMALDDVTLTLAAGSSTAVVGRSGSGKSTLLHLCAGIDLPTTGDVRLFGTSLLGTSDPERTRLRRDQIGLVFQFFHLLPHLSVRDNVALPLLIAGRPVRDIRPRVSELLAQVGLEDRADASPGTLSGGEQQRVAICRSLVHDPKLVLADEPTGNLDDETGNTIMDLLVDITTGQQRTLVFVTHSDEVAARADRVVTLQSGRLET